MDRETIEKLQRAFTPSVDNHPGRMDWVAQLKCPECGSGVYPKVDVKSLLRGATRPNILGVCLSCGCQFSPDTGIIVKHSSFTDSSSAE